MPKLGMDLIRRNELIQATISVIHENAMADPTLAAICERAGLSSSSIVSHYFKSKQDLLENTMRELASSFLGEITLRVNTAKTPIEKVHAVIDANFAPSQCTPEAISAWLWFWSRVPINEKFAEIEHTIDNHIVRLLKDALQGMVPKQQLDDIAEGIVATMYGFWLRFALDPKKIDVKAANRITKEAIHSQLNECSSSKHYFVDN